MSDTNDPDALAEEIEERRNDEEFEERLRRLVEENRKILDKLSDR